ncbi:hypothetical protein ACP70R_030386 [Stipagrostis hirtigluma subsp. patula]
MPADAMSTRPHRYAVVDAFTDVPFRGNPAAVCLWDGGGDGARIHDVDRRWMLAVAAEFNAPVTAFLAPAPPAAQGDAPPRFHVRWFTTVTEVEMCGHATLAAAHFLLTGGVVGSGTETIEFVTMSGLVLTARRLAKLREGVSDSVPDRGGFCIELDFPVASVTECVSGEAPAMPDTLNGASVVNFCKTSTVGDVMIELASAEEVAGLQPNFIEIQKCTRRGMIVTGQAPAGSQVDFFTRLFAPNMGVNEDQVCGSVHCALAPYWAKNLGKTRLTAYMASSRDGMLLLEYDEHMQRVRIRGAAVTIMVGTLLA